MAMYNYKSTVTQMVDKMIEEHPDLQQERLANRGKLWEVDLNPQELAEYRAAHCPRGAYAYYSVDSE